MSKFAKIAPRAASVNSDHSGTTIAYSESENFQVENSSGNVRVETILKAAQLWKTSNPKRRKKKTSADLFEGALEEILQKSEANGVKHGQSLSKEIPRIIPDPVSQFELNQKLLTHFINLNDQYSDADEVDFEFVYQCVQEGADINAADIYGQTILHEAAREWNVDVAKFIIMLGGNIHGRDFFGRAPIHFAAANDYTEMIELLLKEGSDVNMRIRHDPKHCTTVHAETPPQDQTPLHCAAGSDAQSACELLLDNGADIEAVDYRGRSPLFIAAELDRSVSAKLLLERGANATAKDSTGNLCLTIMASKMPQVCGEALDQLYAYNRRNRNQYFFVGKMVQSTDEFNHGSRARNILEVIVHERKLDLIGHVVIQKFISVLWLKFGRKESMMQSLVTLLYFIIWTIIAVAVPGDIRFIYVYPVDGWRVFFLVVAVIMTIYMVVTEYKEARAGVQSLKLWQDWRVRQVRRDYEYCHPMRDHEKKYIDNEITAIANEKTGYFRSFWNFYDVLVYALLLLTIVLHVIPISMYELNRIFIIEENPTTINDVLEGVFEDYSADEGPLTGIIIDFDNNGYPTEPLNMTCVGNLDQSYCEGIKDVNEVQNCLFAITMVILSLRFLKHLRVTTFMGAFIVILTKMIQDLVKFLVLYTMFFAGYGIAFYMIWGNITDDNGDPVALLTQPDELLFMLYRLMLVDEWPYDDMIDSNKTMTYILVGSYLMVVAILLLNLFIALLSDTFQRVYDNAVTNASMQRAIFLRESMQQFTREEYCELLKYLKEECNPSTEDWDDDSAEGEQDALKKITHQVYSKVDELDKYIRDEHDDDDAEERKNVKVNKDELKSMKKSITLLHQNLKEQETRTELQIENFSNLMKVQESMFLANLNQIQSNINESFEEIMKKLKKQRAPKPMQTELKSMHLPPSIRHDQWATPSSISEVNISESTEVVHSMSRSSVNLPKIQNRINEDE